MKLYVVAEYFLSVKVNMELLMSWVKCYCYHASLCYIDQTKDESSCLLIISFANDGTFMQHFPCCRWLELFPSSSERNLRCLVSEERSIAIFIIENAKFQSSEVFFLKKKISHFNTLLKLKVDYYAKCNFLFYCCICLIHMVLLSFFFCWSLIYVLFIYYF